MTCTLCGLDSGNDAFCCAGCRNVYAILLESGVMASRQDFRETALYQRSLKLGLISNRAAVNAPSLANVETREAVYQLSGLWCTSCGWLIEHALGGLHGVASAEVQFASDLLKVRYAPQFLPARPHRGASARSVTAPSRYRAQRALHRRAARPAAPTRHRRRSRG